jgi:hypothetical protein
MKCTVEIPSCGMIYMPSSLKIGIGVQAILRYFLRNLRGCNVGITDCGFINYVLRWGHVPRHTFQVR